jgi:endoglucanase
MDTTQLLPVLGLLAVVAPACDPGQAPEKPDDAPTSLCAEDETAVGARCIPTVTITGLPVAYNTIGFHPGREKRATLQEARDGFTIKRADGTVAYEGKIPETPMADAHTGGQAWIADFTDFEEPGEYLFEITGVPKEQAELMTFRIASDVYDEPLRVAIMALTGQRCGVDVSLEYQDNTYAHGACHLRDADPRKYAGETEESHDGTGGWHDAGDYGKYPPNGAFAAGILLTAWDHFQTRLEPMTFDLPEQGGNIPDFLDEIKWQVVWLLKMQRADGAVYHKITGDSFGGDIMPTDDTQPRYFAKASSVATADFAAVAAMSARIYAPYDAGFATQCLDAAKAAYAFLVANPDPIDPDDEAQLQRHYDSDDVDERLWAAAEIWETTGSADALTDFESRVAAKSPRDNWDWPDVQNLGIFTYVLSRREDRDSRNADTLSTLQAGLLTSADRIATNAEANAYGVGYKGNPYWGINGVIVREAMNLHVGYMLAQEPRYLDAAAMQVDHVFGRNLYRRSFVTGLGHAPPLKPHHRPSIADGTLAPWPGLLIGGPWGKGVLDSTEDDGWRAWVDDSANYESNEVAINWNAALIYALAADYSQ